MDDLRTPYKLRKTISSHTNDVRAVAFVNNDTLVTASRDGKAKVNVDEETSQVLVDSVQFLNSCCVNTEHNYVFVGCQDASIIRCDLTTLEQVYYIGHSANVSCLDVSNDGSGQLVSGSWDTTVRVWNAPDKSIVLKGHSKYVWDVIYVDGNHVLSASADKLIKLWDLSAEREMITFSGHTDVVRALLLISETLFLSASNDCTINKWDLTTGQLVETWRGHNSFIYSLTKLNSALVASSSEDRTVRIWDIGSGKTIQTILLPSISQWCLTSNELGEFAVGSSDNTARIFSSISDRQASSEELAKFAQSVQESAIGECEIDESQIARPETLSQPGKQEGQIVVIRNQKTAKLEAHQFSAGIWAKIGDVVGANQSSGSKKQLYRGKQYDYVFDVDISDDQEPLKLPFNNSDNPYIVAEAFVADNSLPASYVDQIVKFLITNSEAKQFQSAADTSSAVLSSSNDSNTATASGIVPDQLQFSTLLFIKSFQEIPLLTTLKRIGQEKGENIEVYHLDSLLHSLPSSSDTLLQVAMELNSRWSQSVSDLLPVLDLLRIAIADAVNIHHQAVWIQLISALDASLPKHCMLAVRGIVNLVANSTFDPYSKISSSMLNQTIDMVQTVISDLSSLSKAMSVALATLVLNLAIRSVPIDFVSIISKLVPKVAKSGDAEAMYRLLLATGLRSLTSDAAHLKSSWFMNLPQEARITELLAVVAPRIST